MSALAQLGEGPVAEGAAGVMGGLGKVASHFAYLGQRSGVAGTVVTYMLADWMMSMARKGYDAYLGGGPVKVINAPGGPKVKSMESPVGATVKPIWPSVHGRTGHRNGGGSHGTRQPRPSPEFMLTRGFTLDSSPVPYPGSRRKRKRELPMHLQ